jgi:hypothetical protein
MLKRDADSNVECAKRWQQSLDPDLDRSEWRDSEVIFPAKATLQKGCLLLP